MLLMARWSSWDAVLVDLHAGDTGGPWRDVAAIRPRRMLLPAMPVGPDGRWGTWPPSVSDSTGPGGQSVTGGPVGHVGTLPSSTFEPAILLDPGGTSPSSDLAGMLLPAIPVLLAPLASGEHCRHLILTRLVRMARMVLMVPLAILGRCPRLLPRTRYWRILVGCLPRPTLPG